jgi:hypothetical protein
VKYGDAPLVEHAMRALIASGLLAAASTASAAWLEGDGQATTQTREVAEFTGVKLETSADVVVMVGGERRVSVTADSNLLEHVRTDVRGRSLVIGTKDGIHPKIPVRVEISVPDLREVEIDGSGNVSVDGARGDASLSIDGSGDLRWSGEGGAVRAEIEGSGKTTLAGSANQLAVEVSGSGGVDAAKLKARNASVEVEGSGDVSVHVDGGAFRAEVTGSGNVTWSGNGTVERAVVSGSGEIRKR